MENASDAIIMAGAMLIFVIALTVAMTAFSQARETIDTVVYTSDVTNYYKPIDTTKSNGVKNRIVSWETVIPTLYKYYKENYTVVFLDKNGDGKELYKSQTNALLWTGNATNTEKNIPPIASKYPGMSSETKKTLNKICSFDVVEETTRHEPWTANNIEYKANLDAFIKGGIYQYPNGVLDDKYDYSKNGRWTNKGSWRSKCQIH